MELNVAFAKEEAQAVLEDRYAGNVRLPEGGVLIDAVGRPLIGGLGRGRCRRGRCHGRQDHRRQSQHSHDRFHRFLLLKCR